jgi:hypothetical protein
MGTQQPLSCAPGRTGKPREAGHSVKAGDRVFCVVRRVEVIGTIMRSGPAADTEWNRNSSRHSERSAENRSSAVAFLLGLGLFGFGKQFWAWLHLLSLDAPLVAVLWQLLFAKALHVYLAPVVTLIMALVIWLIYVADRILDSYRTEENTGTALRHRFYRTHRADFLPAFFVVLLATGWMAYADLGFRMQRDGLLLAAVVGGYFAVVHVLGGRAQRWFPKEIAVAILFGIGTFMPVSIRVHQLHLRFLLPFLLFLLVLWMNTLFIEYSEWVTLRRHGADRPHQSTILVGDHLVAFGTGVGFLALGAMASHWFTLARPILLAEGLSALALGMLGWQSRRISSYAVRVAADAALLTPVLLLVLGRR